MKHEENRKYLIVGLGNPDLEYNNTLHNVGYNIVDRIAINNDLSWKKVKSVSGDTAKFGLNNIEVVLLKPLTYMNNSGLAVINGLKFWKIGLNNLLIIQDDSDIEMGRLKISFDQRSGGHKGVESIIKAIGGQKFCRLKIGVRPPNLIQKGKTHIKAGKFILRPFPKEKLEVISKEGESVTKYWLENGLERTMNKYNDKDYRYSL